MGRSSRHVEQRLHKDYRHMAFSWREETIADDDDSEDEDVERALVRFERRPVRWMHPCVPSAANGDPAITGEHTKTTAESGRPNISQYAAPEQSLAILPIASL